MFFSNAKNREKKRPLGKIYQGFIKKFSRIVYLTISKSSTSKINV